MSIDDKVIEAPDMGLMEAKRRIEEIYNNIYGADNVRSTNKKGGYVVSVVPVTDKVDIMPMGTGVKLRVGMTQSTALSKIQQAVNQTGTHYESNNNPDVEVQRDQTGADFGESRHYSEGGLPSNPSEHGGLEATVKIYQDGHVDVHYEGGTTDHIESSFGLVANESGQIRMMFTDNDFDLSMSQIESACQKIQDELMSRT